MSQYCVLASFHAGLTLVLVCSCLFVTRVAIRGTPGRSLTAPDRLALIFAAKGVRNSLVLLLVLRTSAAATCATPKPSPEVSCVEGVNSSVLRLT